MKKYSIKLITITALFTSLICLITYYPKIFILGGYIHVGDSIILFAASVLGPVPGAFAGAVGSSLADLFAGFTFYAPFTFVIKGLLGLFIGAMAKKASKRPYVYAGIGAIWVVCGYFIADCIYYTFINNNADTGLVEALWFILWNSLQGLVSASIYLFLFPRLRKVIKKYSSY